MLVTEDVFQEPMFPLKFVALLNIPDIFVTEVVFQLLIFPLKFVAA